MTTQVNTTSTQASKAKYSSHLFIFDEKLMAFIKQEVSQYIGKYSSESIIYAYNRMTLDELVQEVLVKLLRSVTDKMNKTYVRNAIRMVCIDEYRRPKDQCPETVTTAGFDYEDGEQECDTSARYTATVDNSLLELERNMMMDSLTPKEQDVVEQLRMGLRNGETLKELKIPKMSYYNLLNRMKTRHIDSDDRYLLD